MFMKKGNMFNEFVEDRRIFENYFVVFLENVTGFGGGSGLEIGYKFGELLTEIVSFEGKLFHLLFTYCQFYRFSWK